MPLSPHLVLGTRWTFVGGKGGVGKTTIAAALAVELAEKGERMLVLSTDPAHSIGDVLGLTLTGDPVAVPGIPSLQAFELDAEKERVDFLAAGGGAIATLLERGSYLDSEDAEGITDLALPGIDELAALLRLSRLTREAHGRMIVDTAPTGHTLRLLDLPATGLAWLESLEAMQAKHDAVFAAFSRTMPSPDDALRFISSLRADLAATSRAFRDSSETRFILVTNPEDAVLAETRRFQEELTRRGIALGGIVMNRALDPPVGGWTNSPAEPAVLSIAGLDLPDNGPDSLRRVAAAAGPSAPTSPAIGNTSSTTPAPTTDAPVDSTATAAVQVTDAPGGTASPADGSPAPAAPPPEAGDLPLTGDGKADPDLPTAARRITTAGPYRPPLDRRLYFIAGKGGVGKTTVACAVAGVLGGARDGPVLLLSVDPAGSLAEILDEPVGAEERATRGFRRVHARQLDAASAWDAFTGRYRGEMEAIFDGIGGRGVEATFDREIMKGLLDLAPPGVDELMAIAEVIDLLEDGQYDAVVVDTAPTGHFLRLLGMPAVALEWSHAMLRLLLKYRAVVRLEGVGESVLELSRSLRTLRARLADSAFTWFGVVALPESLSIPETRRLIRSMRRLGVEPGVLLVNRGLGATGRIAAHTIRPIAELLSIDPVLPAAIAPIGATGPTGREGLHDFLEAWRMIQPASD